MWLKYPYIIFDTQKPYYPSKIKPHLLVEKEFSKSPSLNLSFRIELPKAYGHNVGPWPVIFTRHYIKEAYKQIIKKRNAFEKEFYAIVYAEALMNIYREAAKKEQSPLEKELLLTLKYYGKDIISPAKTYLTTENWFMMWSSLLSENIIQELSFLTFLKNIERFLPIKKRNLYAIKDIYLPPVIDINGQSIFIINDSVKKIWKQK